MMATYDEMWDDDDALTAAPEVDYYDDTPAPTPRPRDWASLVTTRESFRVGETVVLPNVAPHRRGTAWIIVSAEEIRGHVGPFYGADAKPAQRRSGARSLDYVREVGPGRR